MNGGETTRPWIMPLGDSGLLVRFGTTLSEAANRQAAAFARSLASRPLPRGVGEVVTNLVSALLNYDPRQIGYDELAGEIRLIVGVDSEDVPGNTRSVRVRFDGDDLADVASSLGMTPETFVAAHNAAPLRVLATGFAPGFVYCGFHPKNLTVARRTAIRPMVPAGTVLFAAGQTAIAATPIPTGWHVIGHTEYRNFDPSAEPPTTLRAGDRIQFEAVP